MEGLHVAMEDAIASGLFRSLNVGSSNLSISHIFYAYVALFIGEWDVRNIRNLIMILHCFYKVSSLRINLVKSSLMDVGVNQDEVTSLVAITRCVSSSLPFSYLGIPVGEINGSRQ